MSLSLRARFWRAFLRNTLKEQRLSIAENRVRTDKTARMMSRVPKNIKVETVEIDNLRSAWIRPAGARLNQVVLYLHGGGYVTGSIASHLMMCIPMVQTLQMTLLLPEYRLAPEHPFPAALEDTLKVYRWLLAEGFLPANIIIAGDSAGGGLSVATTLALRDAGEPLPSGVICISPWVDLTLKGESHISKAKTEALLKTDILHEWALSYTTEANLENPLVSPLYADFQGFPPLMIQVGSQEILLDDARMLSKKAKADGVIVDLKIWDGLWHVWHVLGSLIPESRQASEEIKGFIQERMSMVK